MRVRLKGVHPVPATLADGTRKYYYYAWKGGPRLIGEPGSPEFIASYHAAHHARRTPPASLLRGVIIEYRASAAFETLSDRTRRDYRKCLDEIETVFARLPLAALEDPRITRDLVSWRDRLACSPRWKDYHWAVLLALLSWARNRGLTSWRPPARLQNFYRGDRRDKVWMPEHVEAFRRVCSDRLWLALVLALETGQRQGDLLRLTWSAYDGETIRLIQSKSRKTRSKPLEIPATAVLKAELARAPRVSTHILTTKKGAPWTADGFRTEWRKAALKAGIEDLTFHDLRGTFVTRMALTGCTTEQIASITGHTLKGAQNIIDRYLGGQPELARAAIKRLERGKK